MPSYASCPWRRSAPLSDTETPATTGSCEVHVRISVPLHEQEGGEPMPYRVSGLRSWNTNAESFESAAGFYRDGLGAEETTRHQVAGAAFVRLKIGRTGFSVFDAKDGTRPGVPHHTFDWRALTAPCSSSWRASRISIGSRVMSSATGPLLATGEGTARSQEGCRG